MKSRITMFSVLAVILACLFVSPLPAEPPATQVTTVIAQTLAPPLPEAPAAGAADQAESRDGLTWRERRKLGITRINVIRAAIKLSKAGELPSTKGLEGADLEAARAEITDAIAAEIMAENVEAWGAEAQAGDRDWSSFFESLASFLERIMPLIQQLIDIFGGFAHDATLTPTTGLADCVPVVSPPIMLAA